MVQKALSLPRESPVKGRGGQSRAAGVLQKLESVSSNNVVQSNFVAGNIKHFYRNWKKKTNYHIIYR